jgi:hypothetical protein
MERLDLIVQAQIAQRRAALMQWLEQQSEQDESTPMNKGDQDDERHHA